MLEIVFDENSGSEFLGQKYPVIRIEVWGLEEVSAYRRAARSLLEAYGQSLAVIIEVKGNVEERNLLALALSIEAYDETQALETVVFKVKHSGEAMLDYKPYMALANSLRYARDLYKMDDDQVYADIKRLGYLGLKVEEDYIKKEIKVQWLGKGEAEIWSANGKNQAIMVIGVVKALAILRYPFALAAIIYQDKKAPDMNDDELINEIIIRVRKENAKR